VRIYKDNSAKLYKKDKCKERDKDKSCIEKDSRVSIQKVSKKLYSCFYISNIIYFKKYNLIKVVLI